MAHPRGTFSHPFGERDGFNKGRQLKREAAVSVEAERAAVKHQLILPAHLIDIDQWQAALGHAGDDGVQPLQQTPAPIGRAIGHDENFSARLGQAFHHILAPDVFADWDADAHAVDGNRTRHGACIKDALFIEHTVIGQIIFETHGSDAPVLQHADRVVDLQRILLRIPVARLAIAHKPRRPNDDCRATASGLARECVNRFTA